MVLKTKVVRRTRDELDKTIRKIGLEETMRLNALIPVSLHQRLKIHVATQGRGVTVTSIIIQLLEEYLSKKS